MTLSRSLKQPCAIAFLMLLEQSVRQQPLEVDSEVMVLGGSANASLSLAQPARSRRESWQALDRSLVYSVS